jgi:phage head morphogenesis protein, SPP1 gp7 family|uniref:Minor capsid protein n=1 Tax=Siphoviridae sp. ctAJN10 TaxID=2826181 RepID=A0A8S5M4I7_9CAUD|nr:MAG TPA: minor capsid protein [Siphoviridae sp. ctAJN10]
MKNQDYWAKRKANLIYEQMDKAEKQADKFDEIYRQSKAYLDKQINKIFDKFQRDYGLSERDARHVLKNVKGQKDLNELRKVLEARPNDPNIQRLLADLDSPAYAYRMKRLERLSADLDLMRESIYHSEKKGSDSFYSDLMKDSYYRATFDLQQQTGLAYSFSDLPETEIKRLQGLKWTGEAYSDRIWSNTGALASSVKDELLVSLMTGRSVRDTSQAIAERFEVGQNKARRLVRTESAFFHNQMELLSYEDAEITKYKFVAVLDKRTSHICQEHDNKVYDTDKAVPGVNYPPLHPWCRSTTIAHDDDIDYSKLERRARNPETGKVEYVPADMSYKEWYSKYVVKDEKEQKNAFMDSFSNGLDLKQKTLSNFDHHARKWYNDYVEKQLSFEDIELASNKIKDVLENSELSMRFKSENIDKLIDSTRILNQFETGTSGGTVNLKYRRQANEQLFGLQGKRLKKHDYEKYGYFGNKDPYEDFLYNSKSWGGVSQYGDVIVRFSKDKMLSRTTFTINNSLGPAVYKDLVADNPNSPHLLSIDKNYLQDYVELLKNKNARTPEELTKTLGIRYIEAQFHGDVGLTDISSMYFTNKIPNNNQINALKSYGIDVFVKEGEKFVRVE